MLIVRNRLVADELVRGAVGDGASSKLFNQYLTELNNLLQAASIRGVAQAAYPFAAFDWGGKNPQPNVVPYERIQGLNVVPAYNVQDGTSYGTVPGFGSQYLAFLNKIAVNAAPESAKYQDAINAAAGQLAADTNKATAAWQNYQKSNSVQISYVDYLAGPGLSWASILASDTTALNNANDAYQNYLKSISQPVYDALDKYSSNLVTATTTGGSNVPNQPDWATSETAYGYVMQITGNNFGGDAVKGNDLSFGFSQSTQQFQSNAFSASGGISYGGFLGFSANGSYSTYSESSFGTTYDLEFSFQDLTSINVTPGSWFDPSVPSNYKNGPFYPGYSGFKNGSDVYYFGPGGNLSRLATGLVVGYRPKITVSASQSYASKAQTVWQAGGSLSIGPFSFSANASGSSQRASASFTKNTVSITGAGDWGVIVGLVSDWVVAPPSA